MKHWIRSIILAVALTAAAASARATVYTRQVTVLATATRLDANTSGETVLLINQGAGSVFVGGSSAVTTGTGAEIKTGTSLSITLGPSDVLYGIVASTTYRVDVLEIGR